MFSKYQVSSAPMTRFSLQSGRTRSARASRVAGVTPDPGQPDIRTGLAERKGHVVPADRDHQLQIPGEMRSRQSQGGIPPPLPKAMRNAQSERHARTTVTL